MDKLKKLLQYTPLLLPIIWILLAIKIVLGATIEYQCDYLGCIQQFDFPAKDLRIALLDLTTCVVQPFGDYIITNNIPIRKYAVAGVRISTGQVIKLFTFDTLAQVKQKVVDYCQTNNITFAWKQKTGSIKNWWLQKE